VKKRAHNNPKTISRDLFVSGLKVLFSTFCGRDDLPGRGEKRFFETNDETVSANERIALLR
jgi:hypothetical protein